MTAKERVIAELRRDPKRTAVQIAEAAQCSADHVRHVAVEVGISTGGRKALSWLGASNVKWLRAEAEASNLTLYEMLSAVVTDARVEAGQ